MKLRIRALGLTLGVAMGLSTFVATLWAVIEGRGVTLAHLCAYFPGYAVSFVGAILGLLWGAVYGFIFGALVAWLYNMFCKALYTSEVSVK